MNKHAFTVGFLAMACLQGGTALAQSAAAAGQAPLLFKGVSTPMLRPAVNLKVVPRPSAAVRIARANQTLKLRLTALSTDYAFTLSPAALGAGTNGCLSFLGSSMVLGNSAAPWAMMNNGHKLEVNLKVPPTAGKVLEVDLHVQSAFKTTITIEGMGSTQTVQLMNGAAQRITLLTLLPAPNNTAYWLISGQGDSWYFTTADVAAIK
jgi:hypothetical protein